MKILVNLQKSDKTMKILRLMFGIGLFGLAMCACVRLETICADAIEVPAVVNFKQKIKFKDRFNRDSVVLRDTFIFLKFIKPQGFDTALFVPQRAGDSLRAVRLPYNPLQDTISYIFHYRRGDTLRKDTLLLGYLRRILLTSPQCGVRTEYQNTRVLYHTFDSLTLKNEQNNVSLEIFYFFN
ncbi:DUF6452 family protein [Raineya sp.]